MSSCVLYRDETIPWETVEAHGRAVAKSLNSALFAPCDRVLVKLRNSPDFIATLLGLMHAGRSIVLVDARQEPVETTRVAAQAGVALIITDEAVDQVPGRETVTAAALLADGVPTGSPGIETRAWCGRPDALIIWSSGSTGSPKGVAKSGSAMLENLQRTVGVMGYGPQDTLLPLLPFAHQYGLSLVLLAWLTGASLVVSPYRRVDRAFVLGDRHGATVVDAAPAVYRQLLSLIQRHPCCAGRLESVRMYCTGGSPLDAPTTALFSDLFGCPLLDGYGSTELGNVSFATPEHPTGCGLPMSGVEVRVASPAGVNPATRAEPQGIGEIQVRTPDAFSGYIATRDEPVQLVDGWFTPGDLGYLADDGSLFVVGRRYAVDRAGYTIYPELIEKRLIEEYGVSSAIVATPDEILGSRLTLFIEDPRAKLAGYWWKEVSDVLSPAERPNRICVVRHLPQLPSGKLDRQGLHRQLDSLPLDIAGRR